MCINFFNHITLCDIKEPDFAIMATSGKQKALRIKSHYIDKVRMTKRFLRSIACDLPLTKIACGISTKKNFAFLGKRNGIGNATQIKCLNNATKIRGQGLTLVKRNLKHLDGSIFRAHCNNLILCKGNGFNNARKFDSANKFKIAGLEKSNLRI